MNTQIRRVPLHWPAAAAALPMRGALLAASLMALSAALPAYAGSGNAAMGDANRNSRHNIDTGNQGAAGDANTLRIGDGNQSKTFISGIAGVTLAGGGSQVVINSSGQLGVVASSARFKQDIADMGDDSAKLFDLRPVTFHYISDPTQEKQYGLIAEEVDKVDPDLVVRNPQGEIESVRYYELSPMLLNEAQKAHRELQSQKQMLAEQAEQIHGQQKAIDALTRRLARLEGGGVRN